MEVHGRASEWRPYLLIINKKRTPSSFYYKFLMQTIHPEKAGDILHQASFLELKVPIHYEQKSLDNFTCMCLQHVVSVIINMDLASDVTTIKLRSGLEIPDSKKRYQIQRRGIRFESGLRCFYPNARTHLAGSVPSIWMNATGLVFCIYI